MTSSSPNRAQRNSSTARATSSRTPRADGLDERVLAFAEQLGRIAGTVQARTTGSIDGDTLKMEVARTFMAQRIYSSRSRVTSRRGMRDEDIAHVVFDNDPGFSTVNAKLKRRGAATTD